MAVQMKERVPSSRDGQKWGMGMVHKDRLPAPADTVSIEMVDTVSGQRVRCRI